MEKKAVKPAEIIAEKLRRLVEHNALGTEKGEIGVTISIGGTLTHRDDTITLLLERAEEALQQIKSQGKNQSILFDRNHLAAA